MGVCAGAGANDDNLPTNILLDILVGFIHIHHIRLNFRDIYAAIVHSMCATPVAVEECESRCQLLIIHHTRIFKTHALHKLFRCLNSLRATWNRQSKTQLHLSVVHSVAIRLDLG